MDARHVRALEFLGHRAPVHRFYRPIVEISEGACRIPVDMQEAFFHAAGAEHGSVLFKLLDDSAFFAANSMDPEHFDLADGLSSGFLRPVTGGTTIAHGRIAHALPRTSATLFGSATDLSDEHHRPCP